MKNISRILVGGGIALSLVGCFNEPPNLYQNMPRPTKIMRTPLETPLIPTSLQSAPASTPYSNYLIELTDVVFEGEVLKSNSLYLVNFYAPWCGPCKLASPIIEEIAGKYHGKIKVGKFDIGRNGSLIDKYKLNAIPTVKFYKDGEVVDELVGFGLNYKDVLELRIQDIDSKK